MRKMMKLEKMIFPEEAVEFGFAHEILDKK